ASPTLALHDVPAVAATTTLLIAPKCYRCCRGLSLAAAAAAAAAADDNERERRRCTTKRAATSTTIPTIWIANDAIIGDVPADGLNTGSSINLR
ncbi:unnamed protein product, partial [Ectocarpus sp. 12 AP-2014]